MKVFEHHIHAGIKSVDVRVLFSEQEANKKDPHIRVLSHLLEELHRRQHASIDREVLAAFIVHAATLVELTTKLR